MGSFLFTLASAFLSALANGLTCLLLPALWQRAFDPVSRSVVHMTPLPETLPAAILVPAGNDESGPGLVDRAAAIAFLGEHWCLLVVLS